MPEQPGVEVLVLGVVGALLILANGIVDLIIAASSAAVSAPIQFTTDATTLGTVNVVLAILLMIFLGLYMGADGPGGLSVWGTLIAILGAFSLWVGGGFIVGFVLVFTAGVLAIVLANIPEGPPQWPDSLPASYPSPRTDTEAGHPTRPGGAPAPAAAEPPTPVGGTWMPRGTVVWFCRKCDYQNPVGTQVCGKCGTPRELPLEPRE